MTNVGKLVRSFDDIKDDMANCAESMLNEIKNYLSEDDTDEDLTETLYDIKFFAEEIIAYIELMLNKEYDK